jgi:hypothetical protein
MRTLLAIIVVVMLAGCCDCQHPAAEQQQPSYFTPHYEQQPSNNDGYLTASHRVEAWPLEAFREEPQAAIYQPRAFERLPPIWHTTESTKAHEAPWHKRLWHWVTGGSLGSS